MIKKEISLKANYKIFTIPAWKLDFLSTNKEKIEYLKNNKVDWVKIREGHNLVPKNIRNSLAQLISWSDVTPTFKANYIALWSDATPVTNNDTLLWSEQLRKEFDNRYSVDNVAYLDVYFAKSELSSLDMQEVWVFIDWTATVDTGFLLSHINTDELFEWNEDLSINVSFTING